MRPKRRPSRFFSDQPAFSYTCPSCKSGFLVPRKGSFKRIEPTYSKSKHSHEAWDPDWITYRFSFDCKCTNNRCDEVAFVSGEGSVDQRYDYKGETEYYDNYQIKSFYPAPALIEIPENAPDSVSELLEKCFALYWCDASAAANSLRASLEALLTELKIPLQQKDKNGKTIDIKLHQRLEMWAKDDLENSDLCMVLKEVGNLGSHGEKVKDEHLLGSLEIYAHVLHKLYDNDAAKIKEMARKIAEELKVKKNSLSQL